ncbi:MAG TPA: hypothetical protein VHM67_02715 [Gemmatimonadaceae bacterium]|nr:hypothetical protein [Gemmatimonadaceae bacterium]
MNPVLLPLVAQLAATAQPIRPVLAFPQAGIDDPAAYAGYQTRFYRDAAGNTVQIYLEGRDGRIVHLLANADDESIGFTARDVKGRPADVAWNGEEARIDTAGRARSLTYGLVARSRELRLGLFLLGSMRVERDLQYSGRHRRSFAGPTFEVREVSALLDALARLAPAVRRRQLGYLHARDLPSLRRRLQPAIAARQRGDAWTVRVTQPSLDATDTLTLEISVDPREIAATRSGGVVSLRALRGDSIELTIRVATTARALSALSREEIFTPEFLSFLAATEQSARASGVAADATRARRLERQARGVELLSSREKLMAGLPAYATYFGRDMLVSALMMQPIWREEMLEFAIASVLRKLSLDGQVSHEEALGGQAVREHAGEYASLVSRHLEAARAGRRAAADSLLAAADSVVRDLRRTRENYHMIDDELQLPVLVARWLRDPRVTADRKRSFLADSSDGNGPRLARLLAELALVARLTAPYAAQPVASNLVSFPRRDSTNWSSASWRDSGAGYGGGRFAMDVNAIWVPHALAAIGDILAELGAVGFGAERLAALAPGAAGAGTPLGQWAADDAGLQRAVGVWREARRHFVVRLAPDEARRRIAGRLAAMTAPERRHWEGVLATSMAPRDTLEFLALALEQGGQPVAVANSDVATRLFLDASGPRATGSGDPAEMLRDVRLFTTQYPVGLLVDGVGPVVANDAYATPATWAAFERDPYHGPRVVWGREVNLFLLGAADRVAAAGGAAANPAARELTDAIRRVAGAVEASGFHSELWSYEVADGRVRPVRYGTGSDVQLWSTTELAVQYALHRLGVR